MRARSILAAILLTAAISACTQPVPGGGAASEAPSAAPEASATPYLAPGDY